MDWLLRAWWALGWAVLVLTAINGAEIAHAAVREQDAWSRSFYIGLWILNGLNFGWAIREMLGARRR